MLEALVDPGPWNGVLPASSSASPSVS